MTEKEWYKKEFLDKVNDETAECVTMFPIIWLIYEKELFNTRFEKSKVDTIIQNIGNRIIETSLEEIFQNIIKYCNKNYYKFINLIYDGFLFANSGISKEEIERLYNATTTEDKIKFLMFVSFRVRNNMFHGIKEIRDLDRQKELFLNLNKFLAMMVDSYR